MQQADLSPDQRILLARLKIPHSSTRLFLEGLTHTSFAVENGTGSYQRLEFLGDAILNTYCARMLYDLHPGWTEGELTRARSSVVSEGALAKHARMLGINKCIRLGKGESQSGGAEKDKILADVFEALTAVVHLSKGPVAAYGFLDSTKLVDGANQARDNKSELQNLIQNKGLGTPCYSLVKSTGPSHNPTFVTAVKIGNTTIAEGSGKSKREAEQNAAMNALDKLS